MHTLENRAAKAPFSPDLEPFRLATFESPVKTLYNGTGIAN